MGKKCSKKRSKFALWYTTLPRGWNFKNLSKCLFLMFCIEFFRFSILYLIPIQLKRKAGFEVGAWLCLSLNPNMFVKRKFEVSVSCQKRYLVWERRKLKSREILSLTSYPRIYFDSIKLSLRNKYSLKICRINICIKYIYLINI